MALNATQKTALVALFENDPEFNKFASQRMTAAASEAEKHAQVLRSFNGVSTPKPKAKAKAKTKTTKVTSTRGPGRPKGSKNKPKADTAAAATPAATPAKRGPGRPKGSVNKPTVTAPKATTPTTTSDERPDWRGKITAALKGKKNGLLGKEIMAQVEKTGMPIAGGTLNTYLHGMKKENLVKGEGPRGTTRYSLV